MSTHEIVEVAASYIATRQLERERFISVDCEGVNLGKTGPLTLVQIGTEAGHVFLFDVMQTPAMFKEGGLKRLLESETVVKVMHAAKHDGEALYFQFGVELRGVFDTQVAQLVLDRADGRRYPHHQKLTDVVSIHCPQKSTADDKEAMKLIFNKKNGEYWAERPLTPEMIQYATDDVLMLIPEVYLKMKKLLESRGLMDSFKMRVRNEILSRRDDKVSEELDRENHESVKAVLTDFASSPNRPEEISDIQDEDVLAALAVLRLEDIPKMELPEYIANLKAQHIQEKLDDIEQDLDTRGEDFQASFAICGMLNAWSRKAPTQAMKDRATTLLEQVQDIVLRDVERKYKVDSPCCYLTSFEKKVIKHRLRPKGEEDPDVTRVCLKMYWQLMMEEVEDSIQQYENDPDGFKISDGYASKLRFYVSGPVPRELKSRAKNFLDNLERTGHVQRPAPSRGRGRGRRGRQGFDGRRH